MGLIQRLFTKILPASIMEKMRHDSQRWRIRCLTCDHSLSVWDAGGIRWGASSRGKRTTTLCPKCGRLRVCAVELGPEPPAPPR